MIKGPLPKKLEYAILQTVMKYAGGTHQAPFPSWSQDVFRLVPETGDRVELQAAFKRLWSQQYLRLSKPANGQYHGIDYSGNEQDDQTFFHTPRFNATITYQGRGYWGDNQIANRNGAFISHITEERPIAQVLQRYIKLAFSESFPVFVSSDGKSIEGGEKWYNHIIHSLRKSEVVLVLLSQESRGRPWINFEAGVGEGSESLV